MDIRVKKRRAAWRRAARLYAQRTRFSYEELEPIADRLSRHMGPSLAPKAMELITTATTKYQISLAEAASKVRRTGRGTLSLEMQT